MSVLLLMLLFISQLICATGAPETGRISVQLNRSDRRAEADDYQFLCPPLSVSNLHYQLAAQVCVVAAAHLSAQLISEQSVCRPGGRVASN